MSNENQENAPVNEKQEVKMITPEEAQEITNRCTAEADKFLLAIRDNFKDRMDEFGKDWAIMSYINMSLLPGLHVIRQSFNDEEIDKFLPILNEMVKNFNNQEVKE